MFEIVVILQYWNERFQGLDAQDCGSSSKLTTNYLEVFLGDS